MNMDIIIIIIFFPLLHTGLSKLPNHTMEPKISETAGQ